MAKSEGKMSRVIFLTANSNNNKIIGDFDCSSASLYKLLTPSKHNQNLFLFHAFHPYKDDLSHYSFLYE